MAQKEFILVQIKKSSQMRIVFGVNITIRLAGMKQMIIIRKELLTGLNAIMTG